MNNIPVAWMDEETGCFVYSQYEYEDLDEHGKDGLIPLYTHPTDTVPYKDLHQMVKNVLAHPVKELNNGGEPVKNATYWKRQYNLMASQNDNLKSGLYHANEQIKYLESHPVKELTREDRLKLIGTLKWAEDLLREAGHDEAVSDAQDCLMILRKAQENENKP
jgi:hypothetical protein